MVISPLIELIPPLKLSLFNQNDIQTTQTHAHTKVPTVKIHRTVGTQSFNARTHTGRSGVQPWHFQHDQI